MENGDVFLSLLETRSVYEPFAMFLPPCFQRETSRSHHERQKKTSLEGLLKKEFAPAGANSCSLGCTPSRREAKIKLIITFHESVPIHIKRHKSTTSLNSLLYFFLTATAAVVNSGCDNVRKIMGKVAGIAFERLEEG